MKASTGAKDAEDFGESAQLLIAREVMKEETGENVVERSVGKGKRFGHDLVERDIESRARGLVTGDANDLGIGVDGGDMGGGTLRFKEKRECAGAASEVEDVVFPVKGCVTDESGFESAFANCGLDDEVVPGRECAKAESGDVGRWHAALILRQ